MFKGKGREGGGQRPFEHCSKKTALFLKDGFPYIATYFKELMRKILATNQIGLVLPMYYHSPYSDA